MASFRSRYVRRGCINAKRNAFLWAFGNGLVSSTLVIYLALDLGASGTSISWILAAPRFAGVLRLSMPALIAHGNRKACCCIAFTLSTLVLTTVPLSAILHDKSQRACPLAALVLAWCAYHLLEYAGGVALWSWFGDLYPKRIRGRLLGARERWLTLGSVSGMVASASFVALWRSTWADSDSWMPLAWSALGGSIALLGAVVPLLGIPALNATPSAIPRHPWRTLVKALQHRQFRRLITFNCWFSLVNGITASAQGMYPRNVLHVSYETLLGMRVAMRLGQAAAAPQLGQLTDRWGNRPVMIVAQSIVATGPLFFLFATESLWWILGGAYLVWIAYAGLNVGLDNVKLKLAPATNNSPYLAVYHGLSDLAFGTATIVGGALFDRLRSGDDDSLVLYSRLFLAGWIGRTLAVLLLARLIEPGAARLLQRRL